MCHISHSSLMVYSEMFYYTTELPKVSKILTSVDEGKACQWAGKYIDAIDLDAIEVDSVEGKSSYMHIHNFLGCLAIKGETLTITLPFAYSHLNGYWGSRTYLTPVLPLHVLSGQC